MKTQADLDTLADKMYNEHKSYSPTTELFPRTIDPYLWYLGYQRNVAFSTRNNHSNVALNHQLSIEDDSVAAPILGGAIEMLLDKTYVNNDSYSLVKVDYAGKIQPTKELNHSIQRLMKAKKDRTKQRNDYFYDYKIPEFEYRKYDVIKPYYDKQYPKYKEMMDRVYYSNIAIEKQKLQNKYLDSKNSKSLAQRLWSIFHRK